MALDLHKLGWQPLAAGLLAVADGTLLAPAEWATYIPNRPDHRPAPT